MDKDELRAIYKQIRLRMTDSEVSSKSRMINRRLLNEVKWTKYENICAYEPVSGLNEVDIKALVIRLRRQPGLELAIVSPHKNAVIPKAKFDLILVPCLAFDDSNHRLGWGGGWYDKFLAQQPQAYKIGLGFGGGHIEVGIPREPHDIPLDEVITEV